MPVISCTSRALEETVADIEKRGDRLISVSAANEDVIYVAYYSPRTTKSPAKETR